MGRQRSGAARVVEMCVGIEDGGILQSREKTFTAEKQADKVSEVTFKAVRWRATVEYCSLLKS